MTAQAYIESRCIPEPNSGCWLWMKSVSRAGYGTATINYASRYAHRLAWEAFKGPIPSGFHVLHSCDVPSCVNPDHLFIGTHKDNMNDMAVKGRVKYSVLLGETNPNAKFTEKDIADIRVNPNENLRILAEKYGVSRQAVWKVRHNHNWKSE